MDKEMMEEAGQAAGQVARTKFLLEMEQRGSLEKAALRIHQALSASRVHPKWAMEKGEWVYSKRLADHGTRLKAASLVAQIADVMPDERLKVSVGGELVNAIREVNERYRKRTGHGASAGS